MKRPLVVLVLGVGLLGGLVLLRATGLESRQLVVEPALALELDRLQAVERLARAVRIPTVSPFEPEDFDPEPFRRFHELLAEAFPETQRALQRETVGELSLLYTWPGTDPDLEAVLLLAHMDVVPVEPATLDRWLHPPFAGRLAEGHVWGRGTLDDKASLMGILEAVESLLREGFQPDRTVLLAFGHDEEIGGPEGARRIADRLAERRLEVGLVLDEGMAVLQDPPLALPQPVAFVGIAEKGQLTVELLVEAEGGHASMPPPRTAVGVLSAAIHELQSHPMPATLEGPVTALFDFLAPELDLPRRLALTNLWLFEPLVLRQLGAEPRGNALIRTTTAPTVFESGVKENVLPTRARAVVNFRIHPEDSVESVLAHVRRKIDDERVEVRLRGQPWEPSPVSPTEGWAFETLQRSIGEVFPDVLVAPGLTVGATDARHYTGLSATVYRFAPLRLTAADVERIHGINERISFDAYVDAVRFYHRLIENAASDRSL